MRAWCRDTPGGGGTGLSGGTAGGGVGGTTGGAGGAGTGASGVVQSTLGVGSAISSYDPNISGTVSNEHYTQPQSNKAIYGVPSLQANTTTGNVGFVQAFPTGTDVQFLFQNNRQTLNSPFVFLSPTLTTYYQFAIHQQLLQGFSLGSNLRYLRIAKNDRKISDTAFRQQVIVTVTQIADIYWDLVNAYQDEQVKERSRDFARQTYETTKKQLELQAVPAMDVLKSEGELATREQDLTVAKTNLEYQELLIKNAVTRSLDDPVLEEMPVVPTDTISTSDVQNSKPVQDLIAQALQARPELETAAISLANERISIKAARNALLPTLTATGYYGGTGLGGLNNPLSGTTSPVPSDYGGTLQNAFNNSSPDYYVGLSINIPLRNRIAKADQFRSELELKQNQLYTEQLKKRIRIEVRNAEYALEQSRARVESARKARDLQQKTFDITKQEQKLGAGSNSQTLAADHDLSVSESALLAAQTDYEKAKIEVDRAIGATLESNHISIADAQTGVVTQQAP